MRLFPIEPLVPGKDGATITSLTIMVVWHFRTQLKMRGIL